jgi:hypothetical protein
MQVSLTIIRYPRIFIPFAFFAMAVFRLPLWLRRTTRFYKLMGSGKNGTFDKTPDLRQWAILAVHDAHNDGISIQALYGRFISSWLRFFHCETFTLLLEPIEGHGTWDGKPVFGKLPAGSAYDGPVAILTRATIRLSKLKYFWRNVAPVAGRMSTAKGLVASFGIGEIPWIKQATFSIWENKESMKAFAYGMKEHTEVIKKTRQQKWYSEDMFTRFRIIARSGSVKGEDPLKKLLP